MRNLHATHPGLTRQVEVLFDDQFAALLTGEAWTVPFSRERVGHETISRLVLE